MPGRISSLASPGTGYVAREAHNQGSHYPRVHFSGWPLPHPPRVTATVPFPAPCPCGLRSGALLKPLCREGSTPPGAPMISTFWPGWTRPWPRTLCRAVWSGTATTAVCFEGEVACLGVSWLSGAQACSARAPLGVLNTSSSGRNLIISWPTDPGHVPWPGRPRARGCAKARTWLARKPSSGPSQLWLNISRNILLVLWIRHSVGCTHRGPAVADGPAARRQRGPAHERVLARIVFGTGQVGDPLAAYLAGQGIAVRAVSRHRPPARPDVGQGTGPGVHGRRAHLPQQALHAFPGGHRRRQLLTMEDGGTQP
jgi:hypothetical protein